MRGLIASVVAGLVVGVTPGVGFASVPVGGDFCAAFDALLAMAEPPVDDGDVTVLDAEQEAALTSWAEEFEGVVTDLVATAPEEIADDAQVIDDTYHELFVAIRATDFASAAEVEEFNALAATIDDDGALGAAFMALFGEAEATCGGTTDAGTETCPLSAEEVATITGDAIVDSTFSAGGTTIGSIDLLGPPPTTTDAAAPVNSLSWAGCRFETGDGTTLLVAELVDEAGEPDPGQIERLAAGAIAAPPSTDDAFVTTDGSVVVLAGGETLVFAVDTELDASAIELLVGVADAMVAGEYVDAEERCAWLGLRVPEEWGGRSADVMHGSGAEGDVSYESCSYRLGSLDEAQLRLSWAADRAWFDELADDAVPVAVDGLGERAYRFGGLLVVLDGDHAVVVDVTVPGDDGAAVEADDTTSTTTVEASAPVGQTVAVDHALALAALAALTD